MPGIYQGTVQRLLHQLLKEYDKLKFLNFILLKMGCKLPEILMNTNELSRLLED